MADGIALEGIKLIYHSLIKVYQDGSNIEARMNMLTAASMGATAFQKGLGAIHSLSHPVGAIYNTHHGLTNAVFMPYVLKRNEKAIKDKITDLSKYLNLPNPSFQSFLDWVIDLRKLLKIPHTLKDLIHVCLEPEYQDLTKTFKVLYLNLK